jgi:Domain of unknown function (DUF397)
LAFKLLVGGLHCPGRRHEKAGDLKMTEAQAGVSARAVTPGVTWRVSSLCAGNGECVAVAKLPTGHVAVRDTKNPDGPQLMLTASQWRQFIEAVQSGAFGA